MNQIYGVLRTRDMSWIYRVSRTQNISRIYRVPRTRNENWIYGVLRTWNENWMYGSMITRNVNWQKPRVYDSRTMIERVSLQQVHVEKGKEDIEDKLKCQNGFAFRSSKPWPFSFLSTIFGMLLVVGDDS
ncbi:hypothetical protein RHMOL_Rhmol11G0030100 [Rhododendron molle]|uniref:Uncharacterized protein n=1 Tax=Rhododendron molle TaxID=49168 RepID=A0ACC0LPQ1_RHOML|nr:hypothetical protein RHMOL_Rhmol11G0030100 [Rhododendron molle]